MNGYQLPSLGYGNRTSLARSYEEMVRGDWSLGIHPAKDQETQKWREWMLPLVVIHPVWPKEPQTRRSDETATQPSSDFPPGEQKPLRELVMAQLAQGRKAHLEKGWDNFRAAKYQEACCEFELAEGYSSISKSEKLAARLPRFYAMIAVQQYSEATGSLNWMLDTYAGADAETRRAFVASLPDLPSRYGRRSELDDHLEKLRVYVNLRDRAYKDALNSSSAREQGPRLATAFMEAKALLLMVQFAIPEQRSAAIFEARIYASYPKPWDQLGKLLSGNDLDLAPKQQPVGQPAHPAAAFPFNIYQEAQASNAAALPSKSP